MTPIPAMLAESDPMQHVLPHPIFHFGSFSRWGFEVLDGMVVLREATFTNHMLMLLISAVLMLIVFPALARDYPLVPSGVRNLFETIMEFLRNSVAKPSLHEHTDRFMPFIWTLFFFILFNNLLGLVPLDSVSLLVFGRGHILGTATAGFSITAGLAICAFLTFHASGIRQVYSQLVAGTYGHHGHEDVGHEDVGHEDVGHKDVGHADAHAAHGHAGSSPLHAVVMAAPLYLWNFAPHVFKPEPGAAAAAKALLWIADVGMWLFLLVLEFVGAVVKPFALAIRLFANMMAGHVILASLLLLVPVLRGLGDYGVAAPTILGCAALSCLEVFVAFLQAYIFTFLTCMFIGQAVSPEH